LIIIGFASEEYEFFKVIKLEAIREPRDKNVKAPDRMKIQIKRGK